MLESKSISILTEALHLLEEGFAELPELKPETDREALSAVMTAVARELRNNYPYFHPYYIGQMLKPPHPIARLAYMLALWINPNNHALDGGRASSRMEKEAVADLAGMFGWKRFLGHLCGGGTMANLEALWVAGKLRPGKRVVASEQAHYTHGRISEVLGLKFSSVPCDCKAVMDLDALENMLRSGNVGTVVATLGTTGTGSVDPLFDLLALRKQYGFRLHADAAYGGYFGLIDGLRPNTRRAFDSLSSVDSIVIDPHKHGLQPYGCGCVLFNDPDVGRLYKHDSPYTYFSSQELHLGEISLECSRAGASAVALWATQKLLPLKKGGEFASNLAKSRSAALDLYGRLKGDFRFLTIFEPELDIVVWAIKAESATRISELSQKMFQTAAQKHLHLALFAIPIEFLPNDRSGIKRDRRTVQFLRSCLMKPEHKEWMERIWQLIDQIADEVLGRL